MPYKAPHQCNYPGCKTLTINKHCDKHSKSVSMYYDRQRGTASERGYDSMWQRNSRQYLKDNPLCEQCYQQKRLTPATVVHHRIPHKGDYDLMWDRDNWSALCKICHDKIKKKERATLDDMYEVR